MTPLHTNCIVCGNSFETTTRIRARTCSLACRRRRQFEHNKANRKRAAEKGCPPDKHGTATGYTHYRCGCRLCMEWSRNYQAELNKRWREFKAGGDSRMLRRRAHTEVPT